MQPVFEGKRILVTGGTGSLGKTLVRRILSGAHGTPERIVVFSRDEAKQHQMRMNYLQKRAATDEIIFHNFERVLEFIIGDVRDYFSIVRALADIDIVFNAAALKQVPSCEYFPYEAVRTNIEGPENIVRAVQSHNIEVSTVVAVSTDKACKPVNVMGMTKAIQERIFVAANLQSAGTRYICARYGNVLASRGSVIPLFHDQIRTGGPVTITTPEMTRFLLNLEDAVNTIVASVESALPGETYVPKVSAARVTDIARALIGDRPIETVITGIRPGEKIHESLISEEESERSVERDGYFAIRPMLSEVDSAGEEERALEGEFSSDRFLLDYEGTVELLRANGLLFDQVKNGSSDELLR